MQRALYPGHSGAIAGFIGDGTRNPALRIDFRELDSGFSLREPRNDELGKCHTNINWLRNSPNQESFLPRIGTDATDQEHWTRVDADGADQKFLAKFIRACPRQEPFATDWHGCHGSRALNADGADQKLPSVFIRANPWKSFCCGSGALSAFIRACPRQELFATDQEHWTRMARIRSFHRCFSVQIRGRVFAVDPELYLRSPAQISVKSFLPRIGTDGHGSKALSAFIRANPCRKALDPALAVALVALARPLRIAVRAAAAGGGSGCAGSRPTGRWSRRSWFRGESGGCCGSRPSGASAGS